MKKFYLTTHQRDRIVDDILTAKNQIKKRLDNASPVAPQGLIESFEQQNQERDMLVNLFKVEDNERT